jgi:hypothetical protein
MKSLKSFYRAALLIALSLVFSNSIAEPPELDDVLLYTVKKNDTVWGICEVYVSDPLCWKKLVEYNQLKNPKYLPPKSIIKIPNAWLIDHSATALVIAVEGDVSVTHQGSLIDEQLEIGSLLNQQDVITSQDGTAMIKFADDSRLLLKTNSIIRMASLKFSSSAQLIDTRVELLKGRVKAHVEKLSNENSHYEILTPAAIVAVRGTEFRVSRSEDASTGAVVMKTELLKGALLVKSDTNQQNIVSGQAVVAIEKEGVSETIDLLPRPLMALNESQAITFPLLLDWYVIERAVSYKVTLMMGDTQIWEKTTQEAQLLIEDINPGQYQLLIRGIDEQGFEGRNRHLNIELSEPLISPAP